ncbi:hypothetical protein BDP27DRAFT_231603 [Rhodocollybia butyracea]|uniref:Uncharacterized protein n=1 Tax=Rhodocollybia butyracea TaxID=206335 RepID=A0A9P5U2M1_9AGAR|nr:hypothetical protein BDP27DRAFT_231603 [Rhodocollybia butyracea]
MIYGESLRRTEYLVDPVGFKSTQALKWPRLLAQSWWFQLPRFLELILKPQSSKVDGRKGLSNIQCLRTVPALTALTMHIARGCVKVSRIQDYRSARCPIINGFVSVPPKCLPFHDPARYLLYHRYISYLVLTLACLIGIFVDGHSCSLANHRWLCTRCPAMPSSLPAIFINICSGGS